MLTLNRQGLSALTVDLDGKYAEASHTHTIGQVTLLQDALDLKADLSHLHGNITNAGAIGSTSGLPIITTTSGVLTTGSFGTTSGTFAEGNDSRLSDNRYAIYYSGTSSTSISTTAKTATISGFSRTTGVLVSIKFTNGNTAASATLNISSTGAANITVNGANATAANFNL